MPGDQVSYDIIVGATNDGGEVPFLGSDDPGVTYVSGDTLLTLI